MTKFRVSGEAAAPEEEVFFRLRSRHDGGILMESIDSDGGVISGILTITPDGRLYRHTLAQTPGLATDTEGRIVLEVVPH